MHKYLHILLAVGVLFLSPNIANAQSNPIQVNNISIAQNNTVTENKQHIDAMLQQQEQVREAKANSTSKTSSLLERVIAYSNYDFYLSDTVFYELGKTDSGYFIYNSPLRGSAFNYNAMAFEAPTDFYDMSYPVFNLFSGQHVTFDGPYYHPGIMCDSARSWSSTAKDPSGKHLYAYAYADSIYEVYDSSNNIIEHFDQSYPDNMGLGNDYLNTYASGVNASSVSLQWATPGAAADTNNLMIHIYNISGKLAIDSMCVYAGGVWTPIEKWGYNYDVSGNLIHAMYYEYSSGAWQEQEQYFMTYNTDNTINTDSDIVFSSGSWIPENYNTYGYTEGISYYTSYVSSSYYNGIYNGKISYTKHVALSGLPDTLYSNKYTVGTGITPSYLSSATKSVFAYDAYNNPVVVYQYNYNITNNVTGAGYYDQDVDGVTYFYYEQYAQEGVNNVTANTGNIKIYPNPATNEVTISCPDAVNGTYNSITLVNTLGQTIRTETLPWLNETETFSMAGLAPGTYMLLVQDKNGNNLSTQKIIKE